jgi:hypothetical protein
MFSRRKSGYYPGMIANILEDQGVAYLNPMDSFINAHLRQFIDAERRGRRSPGCSLFNEAIGDGHFSAAGSEVWAKAVGRRLVLLIEKDRVVREVTAPGRAEKPLESSVPAPNGPNPSLIPHPPVSD